MEQQLLTDHGNGLWTVEDPTVTFFGLHVGTRATSIELPSGGLLVYSPIALTAELQAAVVKIGPVEHVVAPNLFHHLWAVAWVDAWGAKLHATPKLAKKRKDFPEFRSLEDRVDPDWGDVLDTHKFVEVMTAKNRLHWKIVCLLKQRYVTLALSAIVGLIDRQVEVTDHMLGAWRTVVIDAHGGQSIEHLLRTNTGFATLDLPNPIGKERGKALQISGVYSVAVLVD